MYSLLSMTTRHLPLSAGHMMMVSSFFSSLRARLSPLVMLDGGGFALSRICTTSALRAAACPLSRALHANSVATM